MKQDSPVDSDPVAVWAREYWRRILDHCKAAPSLLRYLGAINVRDIELVFLLYASLRHRKPAPWSRHVVTTFLHLAYDFDLQVPLLVQLSPGGICGLLARVPNIPAQRPDLEAVVRECKARQVARRGSEASSAAPPLTKPPTQEDSLDGIRNYLTTLWRM